MLFVIVVYLLEKQHQMILKFAFDYQQATILVSIKVKMLYSMKTPQQLDLILVELELEE